MIPFTKMATVMLVSRNLGDWLCVKYNLANIQIFAHLYFLLGFIPIKLVPISTSTSPMFLCYYLLFLIESISKL